jgi:carbamoyl-phosphate synthase large subunit
LIGASTRQSRSLKTASSSKACARSDRSARERRVDGAGAGGEDWVPLIIRPSFTLGGVGGGIACSVEEFGNRGRPLRSPVRIRSTVGIGWKEFELEVMRDCADNFVVICSIENIDPMGVHTGDSITVAPALTLTDREYQRMRDAARRIIRRVGVETGGSNIQFAVNPEDGRMVVIEMNPRVSRSSALASKATGFPIAKIAAKLAVGYTLDEIPNDITRLTPASFEPTIDYVVVKVPRWAFEKFPQADRTLTTQMKSVGEAMAIGRTFKEAFLKAFRSLELGRSGRLFGQHAPGGAFEDEDAAAHQQAMAVPTDRRMWAVFRALERGWSLDDIRRLTHIDPWFLTQFQEIVHLGRAATAVGWPDLSTDLLEAKRAGFATATRRAADGREASVRAPPGRGPRARLQAHRHLRGRVRAFTRICGTFETASATDPPRGTKVDSRQRSQPDRAGD